MKRIVKTHPPAELAAWCQENESHNHGYSDLLGTKAHHELKDKLLREQGWLCAYTGRAIIDETSHVEHIKPQNACEDWEDVEYRNVVACFPGDGGDTSHGYGAPLKAGWWKEGSFISPLDEDCERRFRFSWSGHVYPQPDEYSPAKETIEVLKLDQVGLRSLRKARIDGFFGFGVRTRARPLTLAEARTALDGLGRRDAEGHYREFCFVLQQLLRKYIEAGGAS